MNQWYYKNSKYGKLVTMKTSIRASARGLIGIIVITALALLLAAGCAGFPSQERYPPPGSAAWGRLGHPADQVPFLENARTGTLPSGLKYFILENSRPENRAYLTLAVKAGSTLEEENERGLAHFVEHMAFNGTERFPQSELVDYLRSLGMRFGPEVNAYTSFDRTVYGIEVPVETGGDGIRRIPDTALAVMDDWSRAITFDPAAVDLERLPAEILEEQKFRMLVNCNSPEDMGEKAYDKMCENLFKFKYEHSGANRSRLSVNIYKPDFDYTYVIPIVEDLDYNVIRLSISVPQEGDLKGKSPLEYFHEMKLTAMRFVCDMIRCTVITGFDCNFLPGCVLTEQERESVLPAKDVFYDALSKMYSDTFWQRAIVCELHNCSPVIDILPDLQAIRCFGLSKYTKRDIREFRGISQLADNYIETVDKPACAVWASDECEDCFDRITGDCSGGCLLFKADKIFKNVQGG